VQKTSPWTLKPPEAVEKLRDALRTVPSALGFWKLAALLAQDDRCNEAIEALRAGDQLGATNDARERGLYAGLVFLKQGTLEKAETELRTYLKTGSREFQGIAYDMLATLKRGSDVVSAEDLYKASLAVKLREDDLLGQSITLGNLGRLLMYQN